MAGEKQESPWPVPKFHFKVIFGAIGEMAFQEVSGLDTEHDVIEYRAGNNSPEFSTVKMPRPKKATDVTLKKGMFKDNQRLMDFFQSIKMNVVQRQQVTIQLLDEEHNPMFTWMLANAWPMKLTSTELNAESNEIAVETLVLSHEGLTIQQ